MDVEEGKVYWLIKAGAHGTESVAFLREQWIGWVIASPTGSYGTGHRENWKSKWEELLSEGYVEASVAQAKNLIPSNWQPPKLTRQDQKLVDGVIKRVKVTTESNSGHAR